MNGIGKTGYVSGGEPQDGGFGMNGIEKDRVCVRRGAFRNVCPRRTHTRS